MLAIETESSSSTVHNIIFLEIAYQGNQAIFHPNRKQLRFPEFHHCDTVDGSEIQRFQTTVWM